MAWHTHILLKNQILNVITETSVFISSETIYLKDCLVRILFMIHLQNTEKPKHQTLNNHPLPTKDIKFPTIYVVPTH